MSSTEIFLNTNWKKIMVRVTLTDFLLLIILFSLLVLVFHNWPQTKMNEKVMIIKKTFVQVDSEKDFGFEYDRFSPVIFIVGVRESGQDFVRGFLNMQPEVSCEEENLIFPEVVAKFSASINADKVEI